MESHASASARVSTFLFNNVQLGLVYFVVSNRLPLPYVFYLSLAFEAAILFDGFVKFGSERLWSAVAVAGALVMALTFTPDLAVKGTHSLAAMCASVFMISLSLKKIRTMHEALGKTKTHWRAIGYLTAFLFGPVLVLSCCLCLLALALISDDLLAEPAEVLTLRRLEGALGMSNAAVMLHHVHYFSYAYLVPVVVYSSIDRPDIRLFGCVFYIGWLGYYLFERVRSNVLFWVGVGHIASATAVFLMIEVQATPLLLILWFITALGAGTIVSLRTIFTQRDSENYAQFKIWEAFGHIVGICAMGAAFHWDQFNIAFAIGGAAGLVCGFIALLLLRYRKQAED